MQVSNAIATQAGLKLNDALGDHSSPWAAEVLAIREYLQSMAGSDGTTRIGNISISSSLTAEQIKKLSNLI